VAVGAIVGMGIGVAVFRMYIFSQTKIFKKE
jgi:hypothetical protein